MITESEELPMMYKKEVGWVDDVAVLYYLKLFIDSDFVNILSECVTLTSLWQDCAPPK
jgi:hypothetical protein